MKTKKKIQEIEQERDAAMESVAQNAEMSFEQFSAMAQEHMVRCLERKGKASGEELTDYVLSQGVEPHDDRAFGPVIAALSRKGIIRRVGWCPRSKGHLTGGGSIWALNGGGAR